MSKLNFKSARALERAWSAFKADCDAQGVTYTIEGFCVFAHLSRAAFAEACAARPCFADALSRMREECEVDARKKFELKCIPAQLASLWMSAYGYGSKPAPFAAARVVFLGADDLED